MSITVEVAVGVCVVWKARIAPTTVTGLRTVMKATPQQFKSNADAVHFRTVDHPDEALPDDYLIDKSMKLWAKNRTTRPTRSAAGSKKSAPSKKTVFEALTIPLNCGSGHPTSFIYGDESVTMAFATQDGAKEYFETLCED